MAANDRDIENTAPEPENDDSEAPANFEKAISATGYGMFNLLLLLAAIPAGWSSIFDTTTIAFILPSAECDLELNVYRKGTVAGITYAGMLSSAFLWGFIADHMGRRQLLLFGLMTDFICNIVGSSAPTYFLFLLFKFLSGVIVCGPFAILMTYLAEFHGEDHRSRMMMWTGLLFALGNIVIPALAWTIIPQPWSFTLFQGSFVFNSWRIMLLACSLPPLLGFFTMAGFPESPKFLMTRGRTEEALNIFKKMYMMNTGKPEDTFPIKALQPEQREKTQSLPSQSPWQKVTETWSETKDLFAEPHITPFLTVIIVQFGAMTGLNTLRLWLPQLLTLLNYLNTVDSSLESVATCGIRSFQYMPSPMDATNASTTGAIDTCIPMYVSPTVFINSIIIATVSVSGVFLAGLTIDAVGKKNILLIAFLVSMLCSFAVYWVRSTIILLVLATTVITLTRVSTTVILGMTIDIAPTSSRTMAASLTVMIGRTGALTGNLLFPLFIDMGCLPPFLFLGSILLVCLVSSIFLPKPSGNLR